MNAYLVQYGRSAYVGRFTANTDCVRGDRVVIRGPRGLELGTVMCEATRQPDADGEVVRIAIETDESTALRLESLGQTLLASARHRTAELNLPMELIDVEVSLDEHSAILHGLPWSDCDATELFEELSRSFKLLVRLLDVARTPTLKEPPTSSGCGKPGCGTDKGGCTSCGTGGGCSTGSCSSGKVKSADELTAYFADLRRKMEADSAQRVPLA